MFIFSVFSYYTNEMPLKRVQSARYRCWWLRWDFASGAKLLRETQWGSTCWNLGFENTRDKGGQLCDSTLVQKTYEPAKS